MRTHFQIMAMVGVQLQLAPSNTSALATLQSSLVMKEQLDYSNGLKASRAPIEKYIGGLPMQIQDTAFGSKPITLENAIRLAATLTGNHVKAGTLTRKGVKKAKTKANTDDPSEEVNTEPINPTKPNTHKRKARNFAMETHTIPAIPVNQQATKPNNKPYMGTSPLCNTCRYHHAST
ncbi:hypothetical protein E3N88_26051 [Mikania micrantha]|uniref:Uncharacterized protein n=1 Tax=Mikania micrantha TaxID=192012 RepID=A0A5N6N7G7_9ASTR|nr:hypothetical protein E3N88_26051 [Mikania micrantha]